MGVRGTHRAWSVCIPANHLGSQEPRPERFGQGEYLLSYLQEAFVPPRNETPVDITIKNIQGNLNQAINSEYVPCGKVWALQSHT